MGNFAMPAFGPVMLSSVMATVVSRMYFGDHPAFVIPAYSLVSAWVLQRFAILPEEVYLESTFGGAGRAPYAEHTHLLRQLPSRGPIICLPRQ